MRVPTTPRSRNSPWRFGDEWVPSVERSFRWRAASPARTASTTRSYARSWRGIPKAPTARCCTTSASSKLRLSPFHHAALTKTHGDQEIQSALTLHGRPPRKVRRRLLGRGPERGKPGQGKATADPRSRWRRRGQDRPTGGLVESGAMEAGDPALSLVGLHQQKDGVPERIRTSDLRFRKPLLYPAELRGRAPGYSIRHSPAKGRCCT